MPYTVPRTWSQGETVTAALFNISIRDNLNALWDRHACVQVGMSTGQSIPASVWTDAVWNVVDVDTAGMFDGSSGLVIPEAGKYSFGYRWGWAPVASNTRQCYVTLNSVGAGPVPPYLSNCYVFCSSGTDQYGRRNMSGHTRVFAEGDVLRLIFWQDTGAALVVGNRTQYGLRWSGFYVYRADDN